MLIKHLAGRHDQQTHAGDRRRKSSSMANWLSKPIDERRSLWSKLSIADRDGVAKASTSIKSIIEDRLGFAGPRPISGRAEQAAQARLSSLKGFVMPDAKNRIEKAASQLSSILRESGVKDEAAVRKIVLDAVDTLAVQENEALRRTLGDHGVRHIMGDVYMAMDVLGEVPGHDSPKEKAAIFLAGIYHDTGYLTEPSQIFLDEDHPRWSSQHFNKNVRPDIEASLGKEVADLVSKTIDTHYTADIDWQSDTVASAFRVADNSALFKDEKMPGLLHYVPENFSVINDFADNKISIDEAKSRIATNIRNSSKITPEVRAALLDSVDEFSPFLVKTSLGMLAGKVKDFDWRNDALWVELKRDPGSDKIQKVLDVGQRQFKKFAESLGVDPNDFTSKGSLELMDDGKVVLRAVIKSSALIESLTVIVKHLAGRHDQKRHARITQDFDPLKEDNLAVLGGLGIEDPDEVYKALRSLGTVKVAPSVGIQVGFGKKNDIDFSVHVASRNGKARYTISDVLSSREFLSIIDFSCEGGPLDLLETLRDIEDLGTNDKTGQLDKRSVSVVLGTNGLKNPAMWEILDTEGYRLGYPPDILAQWMNSDQAITTLFRARHTELPVGRIIDKNKAKVARDLISQEIAALDHNGMTISPASLGPILRTVLGKGNVVTTILDKALED